MATGIPTNRTNINLPAEVSEEILSKTQEASAIMQLARQINLPGRGVEIPVIVSDPEAAWVGETGKKPVSNPELDKKVMTAYKLAVIVPFSNEFRRDAAGLYDELVRRLPGALAKKFDATVYGAVAAPGSNFDTFAAANQAVIDGNDPDVYGALVEMDTLVSANDGIMNGIVISPRAKSKLLEATDKDGRPLFINNVSEGAVPMILGAKTVLSKAANYEDEETGTETIGLGGDWTQALYGTVEGVTIGYSEDATLDLGEGQSINLFQHNMFAVRAEIEVGFRANTDAFCRLGYKPGE